MKNEIMIALGQALAENELAEWHPVKYADKRAAIVAASLSRAGFVVVPKTPTKEMVEAAWASALDEDAEGVWEEMIETIDGDSSLPPTGEQK